MVWLARTTEMKESLGVPPMVLKFLSAIRSRFIADRNAPSRLNATSYILEHTKMINLQWVKSPTNSWLNFDMVNLSNVTTGGVYIIWYSGNPGRVVYVGQGDVAARIANHRKNSEINAYGKSATLLVTWAAVAAAQRDGVERYLADTWHPLVGDAHPDFVPIAVNSP
jgi:hypothetical protein